MGALSAIRAVFLDAGNVLIHTPVSQGKRLSACLLRQGFAVDAQEANAAARRAAHDILAGEGRWVGTPEEETQFWVEYWPHVLALLGLNDPDGQLACRLNAEVTYVGFLRAYPDVRRALTALSGRYRLGLISNAFPSLRDVMDDLDLTRFFESMVTSASARVAKPDLVIYQKALDSLGAGARESVFVDDRPANLETAEKMGFRVYLMDRDDSHPGSPYERLTDMMDLVKRLMEH